MVEKVKIGDKEYVIKDNPELLALLETARKEEKDKLHGEIALQKNKVAELTSKIDGSTKATEELEKAKEELAKLNADKIIADNDVKKLSEQIEELKNAKPNKKKEEKTSGNEELLKSMQSIIEKNNEKFNSTLEEMQKKIEEANKRANTVSVSAYRDKLLAEHKGNIIPEFLTGNTVEELKEKLSSALETSKKYILVKDKDGNQVTLESFEKANKDTGTPEGEQTGTVLEQLLAKASGVEIPAKKVEETIEVEDISKLSSEEFAKNKDAIKAQLKAKMEAEKDA